MPVASELEIYMLELVNGVRAEAGLGTLTLELNLNEAADAHSDWMLETNVFSHTGVDQSSSNQRMREAGMDFSGSWSSAENIAVMTVTGPESYMDEVQRLHVGLMNSPGHRANILHPETTHIGIGILVDNFTFPNGVSGPSVMITQNFASTGGAADEDRPGTNGADTLTTAHGNDILRGMEGHDILTSNAGHDRLEGGAGDDTLQSGTGDDMVLGGEGQDLAFAGNGQDMVFGGGGNDVLHGNQGRDSIEGGNGNDQLFGGIHYDTIRGGDGDDSIWGGDGRDLIFGGNGNDVFNDNAQGGVNGQDTVWGYRGDDTLKGGGGNDVLHGNRGNDSLTGGDGDDRLLGGLNDDVMTGGAGVDSFVFNGGVDVVTDYAPGVDRLEIDAALWTGSLTTAQVIDTYASVDRDSVVFDFGAGDTLTLNGVSSINNLADDLSLF